MPRPSILLVLFTFASCTTPSFELMHYAPLGAVQGETLREAGPKLPGRTELPGVSLAAQTPEVAARNRRYGILAWYLVAGSPLYTVVRQRNGQLMLWTGWLNRQPGLEELRAADRLQLAIYQQLRHEVPALPDPSALQRLTLDHGSSDQAQREAWRNSPPLRQAK